MEETNKNIEHDLVYYKSGIRQLYVKSYQMYIMGLIALMLLTVTGIGVSTSLIRMLLVLVFIVEIAGLLYLLRFLQEATFEAYFQTILAKLPEAFPAMEEGNPQEDDQAYYFLDAQGEMVKLNKRNIRNFPSTMRQFTLLVGFNFETDRVRFEQPLHFYYYDITRITHSENYKKDLLKSTNFIAKRRKRRIKSLIITLIIFALLGTVLYIAGKSFLDEQRSKAIENEIRQEIENEMDEQKTTVQNFTISRGDETLKADLPKDFHQQMGYLIQVDDEKGRSYQTFISEAFTIDISMVEKSLYTSFSEYLEKATQTRSDDSVKMKDETLHPDFFTHEYIEQSKNNQTDASDYNGTTIYYFETEENYGMLSCVINSKNKKLSDIADQAGLSIMKSLKLEREENLL
ncbi:hypothetical protein [Candidatus Enterococcus ikei]|uniref:Uncharacterized protein n=1 Tax=Candidatus Enterococcus ikei TaxID=2815326 RepID=A0ABS3GV31_9ENTE|nr:hypothetical protein [Enterococcus sp. DIV0869a]MBO0438854.1 hypothetical protein [Enterococcus sp. DIV0869a]